MVPATLLNGALNRSSNTSTAVVPEALTCKTYDPTKPEKNLKAATSEKLCAMATCRAEDLDQPKSIEHILLYTYRNLAEAKE